MTFGAALQDQRIQRHDEQAAEHADQRAVECDVPAARGQEFRPGNDGRARGVHAGMFKVQVEQAHRHADGSERHEADLHLVAGEPFAGQRAERSADGERREQQRVHRLVAADDVARISGQLRQDQRANQPEPRDA